MLVSHPSLAANCGWARRHKCILPYRHSVNATIVDLRYRMKDVLRAIDRGETVTILHRGKKKALLMPIASAPEETAPKTEDQPLFGLWKDREDLADPASYVRNWRLPRHASAQHGGKKRPGAQKSK